MIYRQYLHKSRLLACYVVLLLVSCEDASRLRPPLLPTTSLMGSMPFAVVNFQYVKAYEKPGMDSKIIRVYRGGDVVQLGVRTESQDRINGIYDYWYHVQVDGGDGAWIFGTYLDQYALEIQARAAAARAFDEIFVKEGASPSPSPTDNASDSPNPTGAGSPSGIDPTGAAGYPNPH